MLPWKNCLNNQIINSEEEIVRFLLADIIAHKILKSCKAPFASEVLLIFLLTFDKLSILFIHTIVCQMLKPFVLAITCILIVYFSGKSAQTFLIDKYPQRIDSCNCYIDSQIKFEAVDQ